MTDPVLQVSERLLEVLGRPRLVVDPAALAAQLGGKRIMITGAAGSIGSELSALLAGIAPAALTLLDLHENSLFHLRQQLAAAYPDARLRFVLADVRNARRLGQVLDEDAPEVIFHLAAYKHVPLAEELPAEFIAVNVLGTWRLLQEARRAGVRTLVYPSTDKAVNPPSVYGATKRAAELILRASAAAWPDIDITTVRLVNVIGARGGVIETFIRQICAGRPVSVTDPRMTRYWITMDEALLLLTSAAGMPASGRTILLDLGDPINVGAMAERLWAMLGRQEGPLRVEYSGIRPGERLAEELAYADEDLVRSDLPHILQVRSSRPPSLSLDDVAAWLDRLAHSLDDAGAGELRRALFDFVSQGVGV